MGKRQADRYASSLTNLVIVFTLVLSAAAFIFAPQLVSIFAPQFEGLQAALTVQMVRALMCIVVMTALINVFSGLLNAQQRFIPAQLIGFPLSIAMIAFAVFASKRFGVQAMVYGLVVGTVGQLLLMMLSLKGVFKYAPIMNIRSKAIRKTFAMTIPAFLGTSLDLINQAVDKALASGLVEGSISAISYATQLTTLVNALIAAPIALTIFTSLSKYEATGDRPAVKGLLHKAVSTLLVMLIPIMIYSLTFPREIVSIVYGRGSYGQQAVQLTSTAFLFYALALPAWGVRLSVTRCFLAQQDARTPVIITFISVALNIALNLWLVKRMAVAGLALATSISIYVSCILLLVLLRRKIGALGILGWVKDVARIGLASICILLSAVGSKSVLSGMPPIILVGVAAIVGLLLYVVVLWLLKQQEVREAADKVMSYLRRRNK